MKVRDSVLRGRFDESTDSKGMLVRFNKSGTEMSGSIQNCASTENHSPILKIPVTTGLSFLPLALAKALMVNSVPFTIIGA
jgi:hypothetical protein